MSPVRDACCPHIFRQSGKWSPQSLPPAASPWPCRAAARCRSSFGTGPSPAPVWRRWWCPSPGASCPGPNPARSRPPHRPGNRHREASWWYIALFGARLSESPVSCRPPCLSRFPPGISRPLALRRAGVRSRLFSGLSGRLSEKSQLSVHWASASAKSPGAWKNRAMASTMPSSSLVAVT